MKTFKLSLISCLALMFFFASANLSAQNKNQKIDRNTLILIKHKGEQEKVITENDIEEIIEDFNIEIDTDSKEFHFMRGNKGHHIKNEKAFLGIYSSTHDKGIVIDKVVKNSAAEKSGLLAGDVITAINESNIRNVLDLKNAMKTTKAGEVINVQYIRGDKTFKQNVTLGKKATPRNHHTARSSSHYQVDPCKVFIGVYTTSRFSEKGVRVNGVINNTPAMEANIQKGDIITAIDGMPVKSHLQLKVERDKHNQGDSFEISYIRQGVPQTVTAYFKSCEQIETTQELPVEIKEEVIPTTPAIAQPTNNTLKVKGFEAYPNPTFGNIQMNFKADAKPTTVRIVDVTGRVLFNENLNNFDGMYNRDVDVSNGTAGVLTITITQDGKIFAKNVILLTRA